MPDVRRLGLNSLEGRLKEMMVRETQHREQQEANKTKSQ